MKHRRTPHAALALVAALALAAAPAYAHPPRPTDPNQPLRDGCQRSDFGVGFNSSPQWVYVYRNPAIRKAAGIARVTHPTRDDSVLQHRWYDFNANLQPDAPYRYLVAGTRHPPRNNFASKDEEFARLHFEWEERTLPYFAWPTDGDRVTLWGSWIWDCGHWTSVENNTGGHVTGEHSELHPLNAIVVHRRAPYRPSRRASETDFFMSSNGNGAHAVEKCALSHHPASSTAYDPGFTPCAENPRNRIQPLERRYSFFVPAPPRPSSAARLRFRVIRRVARAATERIAARPNGLAVTVTPRRGARDVRYGTTYRVWWSGRDVRPPTALRVTLKSILVRQADPQPENPDPTPPPWTLYMNVNGYWKLLDDWAPRLYGVHDGERIPINRSVRINVPQGAGLWFQVDGRECDEPSGTTLFGITAGLVRPCPANRDEINPNVLDLLMNDDTGTVLDVYPSAAAALGTHVRTSKATVRWPHTGRISLGNGKQGAGDYVLRYRITRIRPARFTG